jgi:phenylacetate-CoA ligase
MKQAIYFSMPPVARNLAAWFVGWKTYRRRFTGLFPKWQEYFRENIRRSATDIQDEQLETAEAWLRDICATVPYYNSILGNSSKVRTLRLQKLDDLARLPSLPKEKVREAPAAFLVRGAGTRGLLWHRTSGSTGSPMRVPRYPESEQFHWALIWARARHGVTRSDRHISFTGQTVCDPKSNRPPFWVDNWWSRQRFYSIYHLSIDNLRLYADTIEQFQPEYIVGYSNAVAFLASGLSTLARPLAHPPRAFFAGSEQLLPSNRRVIEQELKCRVWDHYGQAEFVCAITEHPCGRYHLSLDYSHVEFDPGSYRQGWEHHG